MGYPVVWVPTLTSREGLRRWAKCWAARHGESPAALLGEVGLGVLT